MTFAEVFALAMAACGLLLVYLLPREVKKPRPKTTVPKLTIVEQKRRSWR